MNRKAVRSSPLENQEQRFLKALGRRIGYLASKRNVSIERIAYEAGVSKGYLYDIVKGQGNPTALILHRLATALDVEPWALLKF